MDWLTFLVTKVVQYLEVFVIILWILAFILGGLLVWMMTHAQVT